MNNTGQFIVIEGSNGSGKSTVIESLSTELSRKGHSVVLTREPGGTTLGEQLREILLTKTNQICDISEMMLFCAARAQHIEEIILPGLNDGHVVLCDRFDMSTAAFQAYGRGIPLDVFHSINNAAIGDLRPDLTLLLDLDAKTGLERVAGRGDSFDRIESTQLSMLESVREGYLEIAENWDRLTHVIDSSQPLHEVIDEALSISNKYLEQEPDYGHMAVPN